MEPCGLSRRKWLGTAVSLGLAPALAATAGSAPPSSKDPFGYCLNTATVQGQKLSLPEEIEVAAKAGYYAIEPWTRELDQYVKDGGTLKDLGKRIADHGLTVESAIGFCEWIVDDDKKRRDGLEEARRVMDAVRQIGGKRLAAPPAGATDQAGLSLLKAAERYRQLLDIGEAIGVIPQVEVWGFSKTLSRLGEAVLVAVESGSRHACVLADVFHLYKGGSGYKGLALLGPSLLQVIHLNDYPDKPRAEINDAMRVYPGDGVAPLKEMFQTLHAIGFRGMLSLELFNRDYWKQDALTVARAGLEKLRAVVQASLPAQRLPAQP
jgi:sugar phosphate isomerase/epimerase